MEQKVHFKSSQPSAINTAHPTANNFRGSKPSATKITINKGSDGHFKKKGRKEDRKREKGRIEGRERDRKGERGEERNGL